MELLDLLSIHQNLFIEFSDISIELKHASNRLYTVPAAQG